MADFIGDISINSVRFGPMVGPNGQKVGKFGVKLSVSLSFELF